MPWFMQVLRNIMRLKKEKENKKREEERKNIITHELTILWHLKLILTQGICPCFFTL